MTFYSGITFAFRANSTEGCRIYFCVVIYLEFWDFEEWANRANIFPVFPDCSKGCLNIVCTRYTLKSGSRCIQDFEVAGDFGPVFVDGKGEYFK